MISTNSPSNRRVSSAGHHHPPSPSRIIMFTTHSPSTNRFKSDEEVRQVIQTCQIKKSSLLIHLEPLLEVDPAESDSITFLSFYRFGQVENPKKLAANLRRLWDALGVKGRVLVAEEGYTHSTYTHTYTHTHTHTHSHSHTHTHTHTHTHSHTHSHSHSHRHTHTHTHNARACAYHTHTRIRTNTQTHTSCSYGST